MKRTVFFAILVLLAAAAYGQKPDPKNLIPTDEPAAWSWVVAEDARPAADLLVGYKVKEAFGARIQFGSIKIKSVALYRDAAPDTMLNELIAALGRAGLLANIKGLDNPKRASITILSWQRIEPGFVNSTEAQ
jgi:hypothetical protein